MVDLTRLAELASFPTRQLSLQEVTELAALARGAAVELRHRRALCDLNEQAARDYCTAYSLAEYIAGWLDESERAGLGEVK